MSATDAVALFRAWVADPVKIAAIAPSGMALARLMTRQISAHHAPVLELGPGTGVFTRALLERGVHERDLTLIEQSADFAGMLQRRFPAARVFHMDAVQLATGDLFEASSIGSVVSGLPMRSMQPGKVMAILSGAFRYLRPQGAFYQFTYRRTCPVPEQVLDRLDLSATHIGRTLFNVPPASVYRISRRRRGLNGR